MPKKCRDVVPIISVPKIKGEFSEDNFRRMIDWLISKGIGGIINMGWGPGHIENWSEAEIRMINKACVDIVNGRVYVFGGALGVSTAQVIKRAKEAEDVGCDGVFISTPCYSDNLLPGPNGTYAMYWIPNKERAVIEHFRAISDAINIDMISYNTPKMYPEMMPGEMILKISEAAPHFTYMKCQFGNFEEYIEYTHTLKNAGNKMVIVSGSSRDNWTMLSYKPIKVDMIIGGAPIHLPDFYIEMWNNYKQGNFDKAREVWFKKIQPAGATGTNGDEFLKQLGIIDKDCSPLTGNAPVTEQIKKETAKIIEYFGKDAWGL